MKKTLTLFTLICLTVSQLKAETPPKTLTYKTVTAAGLIIFMTMEVTTGVFNEGDYDFPGTGTMDKALEIVDFEMAEENSVSVGSISGGGGAGKASPPTLSFTAYLEKAMVGLYKTMLKGGRINEVKIFTYYPFGMNFNKLEEIFLKNVYVSNASGGGDSANFPELHKFSLKFEAIKKIGYKYSPSNVATPSVFTWNYNANDNSY
jgi:type VI protein secretion system component Hcp